MKRKLLVLDLDQTLIKAFDTPIEKYDFTFSCRGETFYIRKRPHLDDFVSGVSKCYDVAVWSASLPEYVEEICKNIFPSDLKLVFSWCRGDCTIGITTGLFPEYVVIKNLARVFEKYQEYTPDVVVVLDDTPSTYSLNYKNAVPIKSWDGMDYSDVDLRVVKNFLVYEVSQMYDVRNIVNKDVCSVNKVENFR